MGTHVVLIGVEAEPGSAVAGARYVEATGGLERSLEPVATLSEHGHGAAGFGRRGEDVAGRVVGVNCAVDVLGDQVGVDGGRRGVPRAGRGDDLGTRVGDVAGGPDTEGAGAAGAVDGYESGLVGPASQTAQAGEQPVGARRVAGPDAGG
jgi:hypothetical protein